jgi:hypothetical protein
MTPKEKAEELLERFRLNVLDYEGASINTHKAKQFAIIAVDEILNAHLFDLDEKQYWQQVKIVIENL